ncbi:DUF2922 domain-containing protein [Limosilactobacillus reuteri]|uniref:DUF2922 domain-containing protein n=1 Tax=Limosilactobacillus reuteri TaxID=1598 RepID=A0A244CCB8_LIMRT|nr:DUF2922 domain-containing protein [Limosilactobacillus reuteri]MCC4508009.1 DUF2922 domain-containing protein [Limosilactobacillus reuteri]MCI7720668.1 DUF2922 domain-containing protein [Limosilactobacillus reuteri]MDY2688377.1 DUF2922 domain-containing protein [Limosilactobacillus reuteri]MRG75987.1 DUF2922 family protein [Limosilactobacillus reuteri]OUL52951.1 hypothetical protein B2G46_07520 [Limosilactobacillus reuteri]
MRTLNLTFKGSLGKKHSLKLNYASGDLDAETVRKAMQEIAQTHLFTKEGEDIYQQPLSAKYVDTVSTIIFNDEQK